MSNEAQQITPHMVRLSYAGWKVMNAVRLAFVAQRITAEQSNELVKLLEQGHTTQAETRLREWEEGLT